MKKLKAIIVLLITLIVFLGVTPSASALGRNVIGDDNTIIQSDQTVTNVVSFGHKTVIKGTVRDAVIVFNGDLTLTSTANVKGIVLVLGGHVHQDSGARLGHEVYSISFANDRYNSFLIAGLLLIASWTLSLATSLLLIVFSVVCSLLLKDNIKHFTRPIEKKYGKIMVMGAIMNIFLGALSLVLAVTIIGIPVVFILCIIPAIFFFIGLSSISDLIGKNLVKEKDQPIWVRNLYGAIIVVAGMNIPLIGALIWLGLFWLSLGLMTGWITDIFKKRKKTKNSRPK